MFPHPKLIVSQEVARELEQPHYHGGLVGQKLPDSTTFDFYGHKIKCDILVDDFLDLRSATDDQIWEFVKKMRAKFAEEDKQKIIVT